ncbi:MAG: Coenzyme F420 hydrogenase/dehydrogenase, beta subunit C-terminal domain [Oscillospiraceae bacterium]|nr:Coenzyme F420 hydrogenase/dehydrogenase, beta subunit C-terminal domain [Oscillospiraceae bacterium]
MNIKTVFDYKEKCSGCGACADICKACAIDMQADDLGFEYPVIDPEKCISCGKCRRLCHMGNNQLFHPAAEKVWALQSKNKDILKTSQSGGAFAELARHIIKNNGVVYGAAFTQVFDVQHIRADSTEKLQKLYGSKYIQSKTDGIFLQVKADLDSGTTVLFSGTPCQIAALNSFLGLVPKNLFTVEVVCHGVPSPKLWRDYLAYIQNEHGTILSATSRDKRYGWHSHYEHFKTKNGSVRGNVYRKIFYKNVLLRPCCYSTKDGYFYPQCRYAGSSRTADLTIGDFWGIELTSSSIKDDDTGISLMLINTVQGQLLFDITANSFVTETHDYEAAAVKNPHLKLQLTTGGIPLQKVFKARKLYTEKGFAVVAKKYAEIGTSGFFVKGLRWVRSVVKKRIK